ncbi:MAG: fibronectin type III domain-containing protein [Endomicrobiales bacterium]|nr:fibronectin type III domain-containing protein [Endomicrobiales bacterium]
MAADRYVAPWGSDSTGDGTSGTPWRSIQYSIDQSSDGDTIKISSGVYVTTGTVITNRVITLSGAYESGGWTRNYDIYVSSVCGGEDTYVFLVTGGSVTIDGLDINAGEYGGIKIENSTATITYCNIHDNVYQSIADGIYGITNSVLTINNCTIWNNRDMGISVHSGSRLVALNNSICDNGSGSAGGGIYNNGGIYEDVRNNIVINNNIYGIRGTGNGSFNCVWNNVTNFLFFTNSNGLSQDPVFVSTATGDFHLQSNSPCIEAGDPHILNADTSRSDMGRYGGAGGENTILYVPIWFSSIQDAIDCSFSGDTIKIGSGTYAGAVEFPEGKDLTAEGGWNHSYDTRDIQAYESVIDGESASRAVDLGQPGGATQIIDGLTITNALIGVSHEQNAGTVNVKNCTVHNASTNGIRLAAPGAVNEIDSCIIYDTGKGILVTDSQTNASIINSTVYDSTIGIDLSQGIVYVGSCTIHDNYENGIDVNSAEAEVSSCTIYGNWDRGITYSGNGELNIYNNLLHSNSFYAIYYAGNDNIWGNTIVHVDGNPWKHGIRITSDYPSIRNNIIQGFFRGIYINGGAGCTPSEFSYNVLDNWGENLLDEDFLIEGGDTEEEVNIREYAYSNIVDDPLFISTSTLNFHLQSNSIAIDAAHPGISYGNEPAPNGSRRNCGWYGGTSEATVSEQIPPAAITNLTALTGANNGEAILHWTAPGDDGTSNRNIYGSNYIVKYATFSVSVSSISWWNHPNTHEFTQSWEVGWVGTASSGVVTGLDLGATYYFAMMTRDNSNNFSEIDTNASNPATQATTLSPSASNNVPVAGHTADYVLGNATMRTDGSKYIDITFRVKDTDGPGDVSAFASGSAYYTINFGAWMNVDDSSIVVSSSSFVPATDWSGEEYTISWKTDDQVPNSDSEQCQFKFKVNDGDADSAYAVTSSTFLVDNRGVIPSNFNSSSSGATWLEWVWMPLNETHFDHYELWYATKTGITQERAIDHKWDHTNDPNLEVLSTTFTHVTGLQQDTSYYAMIFLYDDYGNEGTPGVHRINKTLLDDVPPQCITDLAASPGAGDGEIQLSWTATGDNGLNDDIDGGQYHLKYSSNSSDSWESSPYEILWGTSTPAGNKEARLVTGLGNGATYYFWLKLADEIPNWSTLSNRATQWAQIDSVAPAAITSLSALSGSNNGEIKLNWTAPGDNVMSGSVIGGNWRIDCSSYTKTWDVNDYEVGVSTAFQPFESHTYTLTGLIPKATYYVRIWSSDESMNWSPVSNGATAQASLSPPAAPSGFAGSVLSTGSIKWGWTDVLNEDGYEVRSSTGYVLVNSATLTADTTVWIQDGLSINTSSYVKNVYALNVSGYSPASNDPPGFPLFTLASPSSGTYASSVSSKSITVNWSSNGNPGYTRWGILRSVDGFQASTETLKDFSANYTDTTYVDNDLSSNTTYWYKIRAYNEDNVETDYDEQVSTRTLPGPPDAPSGFTGIAISTGSIKWSWTDVLNEDGYEIHSSTGFIMANSATLTADTTVWIQEGLSVNTSSYVENVYALNGEGYSPASNAPSGFPLFTLANPSSGTYLSSVSSKSITLNWSPNSNPSYTRWGVLRSIDGFYSSTVTLKDFSNNYTDTSYVDNELSSNTTYWYKILSYNEDNVECDYDETVSTKTLPGLEPLDAPERFAGIALSSTSIKWSWDLVENATYYNIFSENDGLLLGNILGNATTEWIETELSPNTQYQRYVKAGGEGGLSSASGTASRYTHAKTPSGLTVNILSTHRIELSWDKNNTELFRVDYSTQSDFSEVLVSSSTAENTCIFEHLTPGMTYYFAVYGYNNENILTVSSAVISGTMPEIPVEYVIAPLNESVIKIFSFEGVEIKLEFSAGAITKQMYMEISTDPVNSPLATESGKISEANDKLEASSRLLGNTITEFLIRDYDTGVSNTGEFGSTVRITMSYHDSDNDGFVDGVVPALREDYLKIHVLDEDNNEWQIVDAGGAIDKLNNKVTFEVRHFSVYTLISAFAPSADLGNVIVSPNPYKPSDPNFYSPEGIRFINLTSGVKLYIYNIAGEPVFEKDIQNTGGVYFWPAVNSNGSKVASGIYIYYIKDLENNSIKAVGKLAVIK